ncbi:MAG: IS66 family insertion sequence element accessory protein TnpB [Planctomycetes bacterium]|nr:IS66 family insertion sequence element accessory protein TnpB [Planctomycetota bacterium]
MIAIPGAVRIFLYRVATDMRKSFDGLSGLVRTHFQEDVLSGSLFVFVNRRRTYTKILYWDGDGLAIWAKRLEKGTFCLPISDEKRVELNSQELSMLLGGITPARISRRYRRPAAVNG